MLDAVEQNNIKLVQDLLLIEPDINAKNRDGKTALHICIENDFVDIFFLLVNHSNLDFNAIDKNGHNALHYAAIHDQLDMAEILINCGINVNLEDLDGKTSLHWAMKANSIDMMFLLVDHGGCVSLESTHLFIHSTVIFFL